MHLCKTLPMVLSSCMFCCSDQPVNLSPLDPLKLCFVETLFSFIIQFFIYKHIPDYRKHRVLLLEYLMKQNAEWQFHTFTHTCTSPTHTHTHNVPLSVILDDNGISKSINIGTELSSRRSSCVRSSRTKHPKKQAFPSKARNVARIDSTITNDGMRDHPDYDVIVQFS